MEQGYYHSPTIHQETVVFVCEDDLWTVPATGGIARRLTSNLGNASAPALSPDGAWLAFTGRDEGASEVYLMPALGGSAKRLTYLGVDSQVIGWTPSGTGWPDSRILFTSNSGQHFFRLNEVYALSPNLEPQTDYPEPEKLPTGIAVSVSIGPQGDADHIPMVIARHTTDIARWKRYRGGLTGDFWIDEAGTGGWRRLIKLDGNIASPLWVGERVYFVSDHEGIGNLYSCLTSGDDLRRHTDHQNYYVRHPASDGQRIVYHAGADLYIFDPATDLSLLIEIEFYSPRIQRQRKFVDAYRNLNSYDLHPHGHSVITTTRGKPFSFYHWEGPVIQYGQTNGVHYRLATWLYDGKHLVVTSDRQGEERLECYAVSNGQNFDHQPDEPVDIDILSDLDIGHPWGLNASPKANQVTLSNQRQELILIDLDEKTSRLLDQSPYGNIRGFSWSPDGKWLAYGYPNTPQTSCIRLCHVETGEIHTITKPVLRDINPSFDPEGKYLYFLSDRNFTPIYDRLQFELSFPWGMRPYLITLQADLPSPFIPVPRAPGEKPFQQDDANDSNEIHNDRDDRVEIESDQASEGDIDQDSQGDMNLDTSIPNEQVNQSENNEEVEIKIDLTGITNRVIAFPVAEGNYGQIRGISGKALFTSFPLEGALDYPQLGTAPAAKGKLHSYRFEDLSFDTLAIGVASFDISMDHKTLIYQAGHDLRVVKASEKVSSSGEANRQSGWLDLDRIKISIDPQQEWQQMYREAWCLQRDHFWIEDMSGIDWLQVYERYLPLITRIATRSEFSDLLWEMQGELGTSHAYEVGGDYRDEPDYAQGFLGADLRYDKETDHYEITNIISGDVWNKYDSSPLARAGLNIQPGDRLLAINGRQLNRNLSPQMMLVNQARQEVHLTIQSTETNELIPNPVRTITVTALNSEFGARYRAWVEANRQRVHEATDGRVGYLHIPDTGARGFAEFHRGYLAEVVREGLIVDVRYNRGGHVSPLMLEKLARRRLGYDISRWGYPEPYPPESIIGPIVALCNELSASDGDMFSHAFKLMGLGPLIGTRTWGGVIGIAPRNLLVDGGYTTQPEFAIWFQDVGWQVENYGTDPDIEVEISPQAYISGEDTQLERAIAEAMQNLTDNPPRLPTFDNRPKLYLPQLPARKSQ